MESQDHLDFNVKYLQQLIVSIINDRTLSCNLSFTCILKPNPTHAQRDNVQPISMLLHKFMLHDSYECKKGGCSNNFCVDEHCYAKSIVTFW